MKYLTHIFIAGLISLVVACGVSTEDVDATVEESLVKQVEKMKIVYVPTSTEAILEVVVTATPTPKPTVVQGKVYEWDDISLEFEINTIVANSKYENQTIFIRGEIDEIEYKYKWRLSDNYDNSEEEIPNEIVANSKVVVLKASYDAGWHRLSCGVDSIDEVANLSVGDTVVVKGKIGKFDAYLPVYPCSIVD